METVGIIILGMALVAACIYINTLKTDNDLMRSQLSACQESMASERLIFKTGQKEYKARIEELRKSLAEARKDSDGLREQLSELI